MALKEDLKGMRQHYQETGKISSGGGPDQKVDKGASGSKRANNAVLNGGKVRSSKVGPDKNLKDIGGGNFY